MAMQKSTVVAASGERIDVSLSAAALVRAMDYRDTMPPRRSAASLLTDAAWHVLSMSLAGQLGAAGIEPVGMEDGFDVLEERALAFLDACEVVRGKAAAEGGEEPGNAPAPAR
ncbi:hypothetical protein [Gordonibacter urolithinfaciens]|uniref:hypothetical protein n=1 Tax=Gordonibacter urolithinfaciens TaxID=1335613 RepID=UPI003A9221AF